MVKRIAIAALLLASTAHAESEEAKQLFERGRAQKLAGDSETACKSFDASYAVERAAGTALNLAECEERAGNWQFAIELYDGAAKRFEREGRPESATFARDRAAVLRTAHAEKPRPLPPEPTRSKVPLVVAGVSLGVATIAGVVWVHARGQITDFEDAKLTSTIPTGDNHVDQGDCGQTRFTDAGEQATFDRACRASDRTKIAAPLMLAGTVVGVGALLYYLVAKPKPHSAPMIAPTASGGVAATFEW